MDRGPVVLARMPPISAKWLAALIAISPNLQARAAPEASRPAGGMAANDSIATPAAALVCGCGGGCEGPPRLVRVADVGWAVLAGRHDEKLEVFPVAVRTATSAAAAWSRGDLACKAPLWVSKGALRPVDGTARAVERPALARGIGVSGPGDPAEQAYTRVMELASFRAPDEDLPPVTVGPVSWVAVPGGRALAKYLESGPLGAVARVLGPVLELAEAEGPLERSPRDASPTALGLPATVRVWLDESRGAPEPTEVTFDVPGLGRWTRPIVRTTKPRVARSAVAPRLAVTHGAVLGLVGLSVVLALRDEPDCDWACDDSPFGFDNGYVARFARRSVSSVSRDADIFRGFDIAIAAVGVLSTLAPSARHGLLSRWEILEDALVLGEGVLFAYTTPLSVQARFARPRPLAFHPELGPTATAEERYGPALFAYGANRSGAWLGGVLAMLLSEGAPLPYTVATGLALSGLAAASAYFEVRAGLAYPSDVPISLVSGAINGAGIFLWHRWFWGGWPASSSGEAPMRLRSLGVVPVAGGGLASARLTF